MVKNMDKKTNQIPSIVLVNTPEIKLATDGCNARV